MLTPARYAKRLDVGVNAVIIEFEEVERVVCLVGKVLRGIIVRGC